MTPELEKEARARIAAIFLRIAFEATIAFVVIYPTVRLLRLVS